MTESFQIIYYLFLHKLVTFKSDQLNLYPMEMSLFPLLSLLFFLPFVLSLFLTPLPFIMLHDKNKDTSSGLIWQCPNSLRWVGNGGDWSPLRQWFKALFLSASVGRRLCLLLSLDLDAMSYTHISWSSGTTPTIKPYLHPFEKLKLTQLIQSVIQFHSLGSHSL